MLIDVWDTGPIQIPFPFAQTTKLEPIWFEDEVVNSWQAGDVVKANEVRYIVAKILLPNPGTCLYLEK